MSYPCLALGVIALFLDGFISVAVNNSILYGESLGIGMEVARHFSTYALTFTLLGFLGNTILIP
ncbi:MAG: hypothetical protein GX361_09475 [Bacteroidales bacterium]|nr:hypothetical protein [Bacteroidales bacterium]